MTWLTEKISLVEAKRRRHNSETPMWPLHNQISKYPMSYMLIQTCKVSSATIGRKMNNRQATFLNKRWSTRRWWSKRHKPLRNLTETYFLTLSAVYIWISCVCKFFPLKLNVSMCFRQWQTLVVVWKFVYMDGFKSLWMPRIVYEVYAKFAEPKSANLTWKLCLKLLKMTDKRYTLQKNTTLLRYTTCRCSFHLSIHFLKWSLHRHHRHDPFYQVYT